jgi:hypothetical protein
MMVRKSFLLLAALAAVSAIAPSNSGTSARSLLRADGGDPLPRPPIQLLAADGGDPLPRPPIQADGGDPLPRPPVVAV